jgi:catechol 2,3-dioxygenase-like lactoylglutathione lyase family enzyme
MANADYCRTNIQRRGILGHVSFGVRSYKTSKQFYTAIFKPFGRELVFDDAVRKIMGYGLDAQHEVFNVFERGENAHAPGAGTHLAFNAPSRKAVDEFFEAGIRNGGKSNGEPGIREPG